LKFDETAIRFCKIIINMVNATNDISSRKRSDASLIEKSYADVTHKRDNKYSNNLYFNKLEFGCKPDKFCVTNENSKLGNNLERAVYQNKIKISLPPENIDQYLNFNNTDSISQRNFNVDREESNYDNKFDDTYDQNYNTTRKLTNQSSFKIFDVKKDEKKNIESHRMLSTKRSSSNLEHQRENSDCTKISSVSESKPDNNLGRYGINLTNKKEQSENPHLKASINIDLTNDSHQQNIKSVNPSKQVLENLNHTLAGINASNNQNVFIDPIKNPYINIVHINYGCSDAKAEEKSNQVKYNNINNHISAITGIFLFLITFN
jgi:hypothetical protein